MNKETALAQFNKINNKFTTVISMVDDTTMLNHDLYLYREIQIDLAYESVRGTYDDFEIYNINEKPLVTETALNEIARNRIIDRYSLEIQLSTIANAIEKITDRTQVENEELKEMNDFIKEVRRVNGVRKQYFSSNPDVNYRSTEEIDAEIAEKYQGAIQEYGDDIRDL